MKILSALSIPQIMLSSIDWVRKRGIHITLQQRKNSKEEEWSSRHTKGCSTKFVSMAEPARYTYPQSNWRIEQIQKFVGVWGMRLQRERETAKVLCGLNGWLHQQCRGRWVAEKTINPVTPAPTKKSLERNGERVFSVFWKAWLAMAFKGMAGNDFYAFYCTANFSYGSKSASV